MKQASLSIVVLGMVASGGCGGDCEAIVAKKIECEGKPDGLTTGQLEAGCELAMNSDENKAEMEALKKCTKEKDCDAYKSCLEGQRAGIAAGEAAKQVKEGNWKDALMTCKIYSEGLASSSELKTACDKVFTEGFPAMIAAGDSEDVMSSCRYDDDLAKSSEAFKAACAKAAGGALEGAKKKVTDSRDSGKNDFSACMELKDLAEKAGGDAVKEAETLCAEMEFAERATKGIEEAKAAIASKKDSIPFNCTYAVDGYNEMADKSEWSTKKLDEVLKVCFIDLGKVVIEAKLPKMSYCEYKVKQLRETVDTHKLRGKDADFDALLAKTDKHCNK